MKSTNEVEYAPKVTVSACFRPNAHGHGLPVNAFFSISTREEYDLVAQKQAYAKNAGIPCIIDESELQPRVPLFSASSSKIGPFQIALTKLTEHTGTHKIQTEIVALRPANKDSRLLRFWETFIQKLRPE